MLVCEKCLRGIKSTQGRQKAVAVNPFEVCDENEIITCDCCEEDFLADEVYTMYEIREG